VKIKSLLVAELRRKMEEQKSLSTKIMKLKERINSWSQRFQASQPSIQKRLDKRTFNG
jgi:uncharacterized protein YlxW (UPF0749 family)